MGPGGRITGLGEDRVPVGLDHPGHPALGPGEHPAPLGGGVRDGPGPHAGHVGSGRRLGQTEPGPELALGDTRKVALLLLLVAGDEDRSHRKPGEQQHQGRGVGVLGHLLDGDGQAEDARPGSAQLHRKAQPQEVGVPEGLEEVRGVVAGGIDLTGPWLDLVLGQASDALLQFGEFGAEVEVHGGRGYPSGNGPPLRRRHQRRLPTRRLTSGRRTYRGDDRSRCEQPCDRWITGFSSRAGHVAVLRASSVLIGPPRAIGNAGGARAPVPDGAPSDLPR